MFGLVSRKTLDGILEEKERVFLNKIRELERKVNDCLDDVKTPASPSELAKEALRQIIAQVNPSEFLNNVLLSKGLTIEGMVKSAVEEKLADLGIKLPVLNSHDIGGLIEEISSRAWDELDMDSVTSAVAEKLMASLLDQEGKEALMRAIAEASAESIHDHIDYEEIYPYVGEKIVELIKSR